MVINVRYITGKHALNIENSLNTCGDWHQSALRWQDIDFQETENSLFGEWGIEYNKSIPNHTEKYAVANDLRAILDLMVDNQLGYIKGFRSDWICTDEYNQIFFDKVIQLKQLPHWKDINQLMKYEFMWEWDKYLESHKE
jgi:hypothetical protein